MDESNVFGVEELHLEVDAHACQYRCECTCPKDCDNANFPFRGPGRETGLALAFRVKEDAE